MHCRLLFASIDELNAISLISEGTREVKSHPSTILALSLKLRRARLRVAGIPHAVQVKVRLVGIRRRRAVIPVVVHPVTVSVLALAGTACEVYRLDF